MCHHAAAARLPRGAAELERPALSCCPLATRGVAPSMRSLGASRPCPLQEDCDLRLRCTAQDPAARPTAEQVLRELSRPRRCASVGAGLDALGATEGACPIQRMASLPVV